MEQTFINKFIVNSLEYQSWGFNAVTICFIMTLFLTLIQSYGVIKQNSLIEKNKSSKSLSIIFFSYQFVFYAVYFIYGFYEKSLTLLLSSLLGLLFIPIIYRIVKYRIIENDNSYKRDLFFSFLFFLAVPAIIMTKYKGIILLIMLIGAGLTLIPQFLEIKRHKRSDNIEIRFIIVFLLSTISWLIYSLAIGDLSLIVSSALTLAAIFVFWYLKTKYSPARLN